MAINRRKREETREIIEGCPLLTVETDLNRYSKRTNERGSFLVGSSVPSKKYFFLIVHYFNFFFPIAQQDGQAAVLGRLSLGMVSLVQPDSYRKLGKIRDKNVQKDTRFDVRMQS
jgi:hypothetical protein